MSIRRLIFILCLIVGLPVRADPLNVTVPGLAVPEPAALRATMAEARVPGLQAAYIEDCRPAGLLALGVADTETQAPVTARTVFEAASLSKPVFAYLFMRLLDRGAVALDASFAAHLDYPRIADAAAYAKLTPRLALSHRTGLPNWAGRPDDPARTDPLALKRAPGAGFGYSGEGYQLAQRYAEASSGMALTAHFEAALGKAMPNSTFTSPLPAGVIPAYGHGADGTKAGGRALGMPAHANVAFSLRTTAADYARFLGRVCAGEGLGAGSHEQMLAPQAPVAGDEFGAALADLGAAQISWALGWGALTHHGRRIYFHWGDNGAFKAFAAFDPRTRTGAVYFANGQNGLALIDSVMTPAVGDLTPIIRWLD